MAEITVRGFTLPQIAKAVVAALTSAVALLGLAAVVFTEGPLSVVGGWAAAASLVLAPVLVFLKRAEPIVGGLGYVGEHRADEA